MGVLTPVFGALALFGATIPLLGGLRVLTRTGGLARCLPFPLSRIKLASIAVPAVAGRLVGASPPRRPSSGSGAGAPERIPGRSADHRGRHRPPPACSPPCAGPRPRASTSAPRWSRPRPEPFPPGLVTNVFRGFDVCLLSTAPMALGFSPFWSLLIAGHRRRDPAQLPRRRVAAGATGRAAEAAGAAEEAARGRPGRQQAEEALTPLAPSCSFERYVRFLRCTQGVTCVQRKDAAYSAAVSGVNGLRSSRGAASARIRTPGRTRSDGRAGTARSDSAGSYRLKQEERGQDGQQAVDSAAIFVGDQSGLGQQGLGIESVAVHRDGQADRVGPLRANGWEVPVTDPGSAIVVDDQVVVPAVQVHKGVAGQQVGAAVRVRPQVVGVRRSSRAGRAGWPSPAGPRRSHRPAAPMANPAAAGSARRP